MNTSATRSSYQMIFASVKDIWLFTRKESRQAILLCQKHFQIPEYFHLVTYKKMGMKKTEIIPYG